MATVWFDGFDVNSKHGKPAWRLCKQIKVSKTRTGRRVLCFWPEFPDSPVHAFDLPRDDDKVKPLGEKTSISKTVTLEDGVYSVIAYDSIKKKHMVERGSDKKRKVIDDRTIGVGSMRCDPPESYIEDDTAEEVKNGKSPTSEGLLPASSPPPPRTPSPANRTAIRIDDLSLTVSPASEMSPLPSASLTKATPAGLAGEEETKEDIRIGSMVKPTVAAAAGSVPMIAGVEYAPHEPSPHPYKFPFEIMEMNDETIPPEKQRRLHPNARAPLFFETEYFKGCILVKVKSDPEDPHYEPYFRGKRRVTECQLQGQFKKPIKGEIFMGAECGGPIVPLGFHMRLAVQVVQMLLTVKTPSLTLSMDHTTKVPAHVAYHLRGGADFFHVTTPGEVPPELGVKELPNMSKDEKADFVWNTDDVYSFGFYTHVLDMISWSMINVPGAPIKLKDIMGTHSPSMVVFFYNEKKEREYIFKFKYSRLE